MSPEQANTWHILGKLLNTIGNYGEATAALTRAAQLDPSNLACRSELGHLYRNISMTEEAIYWHGEALKIQPDSLVLHLNYAFIQPLVASSLEQLVFYRNRTLQELSKIEAKVDTLRLYHENIMICHPFYLIYHNIDDKVLMQRYAGLLMRLFSDELDDSFPKQGIAKSLNQLRQRHRVGFLSGFFYEHSHSRAFEGLIRHLNRNLFDVVIIHLADAISDDVTLRMNSICQEVVRLPPGLEESTQLLRDLNLNLLFFTDIGMHPTMSMLAARRIAPIQITGWGVPHTSGIPTIDAYISGREVEPANADDHYSETLIRLPGVPCCYLSEWIKVEPLTRDWFLLPLDEPLFGCLQPFEKIHPDFDLILEKLVESVPEAWFVFVESRITTLTQAFVNRLTVTAPKVLDRIILLSRLQRKEFLALSGCIDVILDPFYFCSGISFYESIHSGTPIVSLEGRFLRSRFVAGAYRLMGIDKPPVASSSEEYIDIAVQLIRDSVMRDQLRRQIRNKAKTNLYDRMDYVRGFEHFALKAIGCDSVDSSDDLLISQLI